MTEHHLINLDELEKTLGGHSVFAPSSSKMWLTCLGSLIPNLLAHDTAGIDAATGTVAHAIGEEWLVSGYKPTHRLGEVVEVPEREQTFSIEVTEEMLDYVGDYVTYCLEVPGDRFIEVRVDHSDLTPIPKQGGTSDCITCRPGKLVVTDLKYGVGVQVFAKENSQGLLYAYGAFRKYDWFYDFQEITIRICQPRLGHFDEWTLTREELLEFAEYVRERAHAAWKPNAPRTPSKDGCQWCKIKFDCAARAVFEDRLLDGVFENLEAPIETEEMEALTEALDAGLYSPKPRDPRKLTTDMLATLLPWRKSSEQFWKAVDDELETRCINGENVPGYKLVESRTNRVYRDEETAFQTLRRSGLSEDDIRPRSMIGPAAAETALREIVKIKGKRLGEIMAPIVMKPPGRPTMAPLSDKRPPIESVTNVFSNLEDGDL